MLARRRDEVLLHAGVVQGHVVEAVSQSGRRQVRGCHAEGRASAIPPASRSASPCSTTTATAGPTSSSPTTRSRTSSIAISRTARSKKKGCRPAWRSAKTAWRAARWAPTAGDYDRSGRPHLLVGNFSNQMLGLYHNEGNGLFVDEAPRSPVGRASLLTLTFGVFFFDYDLDGYPDIFAANGHIEEEIGRVQPKIQYAQPPLLFRNLGNGKFENVTSQRPFTQRPSSRAARPMPISTATAISTS